MHNQAARARGLPAAHSGVGRWTGEYRILDRLEEVPEVVWKNPGLVVERFLPEPDPPGGFAYRTWVFAGARERCNRFVTAEPISKGAGVLRYGPVDVPAKIREERARLNFDFGSFDFVIHEGEPILLDANRTRTSRKASTTSSASDARGVSAQAHAIAPADNVAIRRTTHA
jgi:hypothetical protein